MSYKKNKYQITDIYQKYRIFWIFSKISRYFPTLLDSNHTKYLAQLCGRFLRFGKFLPQICESCGATYRRNYETCRALWSTSSPLTDGRNCVKIDP